MFDSTSRRRADVGESARMESPGDGVRERSEGFQPSKDGGASEGNSRQRNGS